MTPLRTSLLTSNRLSTSILICLSLLWITQVQAKETQCTDGIDNDGDTVYDCGDNDCKNDPACQPDGNPENTDKRCSDWVDNDEDGAMDCEDQQCKTDNLTVCLGSWDTSIKKSNKGKKSINGQKETSSSVKFISTESTSSDPRDLLGTNGDNDGERNDYLCADGIDNDGDGKIDCEDPGCLFDDSVQICRGSPNMRFSIVGQIAHTMDLAADEADQSPFDTRFSRLQLRSFGPIPQIQNSFYLISLLTERTPRLTFAMFSVPIGKTRHSININSGAAGLSQAQALSIHKQLLLRRTTVFRAFEQFNSAAIEVSGPLNDTNTLRYRTFFAGGNGRYDGNIGGRSLVNDNLNYPFSVGAQLGVNFVGYYSRFDTPFLYVPVPLTIGLLAGAKYDRREEEHFVSGNVQGAFRYSKFVAMLESYYKDEQAFGSKQLAYHAQIGYLAWPKHLMLAADFGEYVVLEDFNDAALRSTTTIREPQNERQIRGGAHWFFYRDIGVISLLYNYRLVKDALEDPNNRDNMLDRVEKEFQIVAQYRF